MRPPLTVQAVPALTKILYENTHPPSPRGCEALVRTKKTRICTRSGQYFNTHIGSVLVYSHFLPATAAEQTNAICRFCLSRVVGSLSPLHDLVGRSWTRNRPTYSTPCSAHGGWGHMVRLAWAQFGGRLGGHDLFPQSYGNGWGAHARYVRLTCTETPRGVILSSTYFWPRGWPKGGCCFTPHKNNKVGAYFLSLPPCRGKS